MNRSDPPNPSPWQTVHPTTPMNVLNDSQSFLPLGQQLLRAGLITQGQLAQALREQRENFMKFGEVCLIHRWITIEDLYRHTASHLLSLGEILIALNYIDIDQLKLALSQQRRFGRKLGEILLWKSWVTEEHLTYALRVQQHLRQAATPNAWEALAYYLQHNPVLPPAGANPPAPPLESELLPSIPPTASPLPPITEEVSAPVLPPPVSPSPSKAAPSHSSAHRISSPAGAPVPAATTPQDILDVEKLRSQITTYRNKIASLELQLEMQQQDWDALSLQMAQQVADYQAQYEQRIQQLEQSLQSSQAEFVEVADLRQKVEQLQTELELFQGYEQKYQLLLKQQQAQTQELTQARFRIQQLEGELRLSQVTLQDKERALQQQQALVQQLEEQKQHLKHWEAEVKRAQRIEHEFQQLQQQHVLVTQELELLRSQASQWQEQSQQVQQLLQERQALLAQVEQLQSQLSQTVNSAELSSVKAERDVLRRQVEALQHASALDLERELTSLRQHIHYVEAERDALAEQLTGLLSSGRSNHLNSKLSQTQELLAAYRQSLDDLQRELQAQKHTNRCLQARLEQQEAVLDVARVELRSVSSLAHRLQSRLDAEQSGQSLEQALHWAERVLMSLQEAALITSEQRQEILKRWQQEGGELSRIVQEVGGLHPQTVKFFNDEGYLARLLGCRRIGEYLQAAGLVTKEDVEEALQMIPPATRLGEALSQKGVLNPATADYFAKTFTGQTPSQPQDSRRV